MRSLVALLSVTALSACAHLVVASQRHAPIPVECARRAIASVRGLTIEPGYDAIFFKGRGFSGWFHHGSDATFTLHSVDIEYSPASKTTAMKVAAEISDSLGRTCAAQPGAPADGPAFGAPSASPTGGSSLAALRSAQRG